MFVNRSKTYKLSNAVQIIDDEFISGYIVEILDSAGVVISQYFTEDNKTVIMDKIKATNGFKTKTQELIDKLIEEEGN